MGRYVEHLAREWSRMEIPFDRVVLMAPRHFELPELGTTTEVTREVYASALPLAAWEQVALPARARRMSVLFCPTYIGPLVSTSPTVVANHGIYERIPDEFSRLQRLRSTTLHRLSARRAARVIANSDNTRLDVAEFFGLSVSEIDVVHPAASEMFFAPHSKGAIEQEVAKTFGTPARYFIFVGKIVRRRHVGELVAALGQIRLEGWPEQRLLVVGPDAIGLDVPSLARAHGLEEAVRYVPHLEQRPLALLYAGADAFVLPTTYEGISHTMFEAMASRTAVLTVSHPTLEEGAGEAVLTVPTPSAADLADGMRRLLGDPELRDRLAGDGRARARRFSWTETARRTAAILAEVARARDRDGGRP